MGTLNFQEKLCYVLGRAVALWTSTLDKIYIGEIVRGLSRELNSILHLDTKGSL